MSSIIIDITREDSSSVDAELLLGLRGQTGLSAYEYAVMQGYSGSENDFSILMASYATVAEAAAESASESAQSAVESAQSADASEGYASDAEWYMNSALDAAAEARISATSASRSAGVASGKADEAGESATSASNSADAAASSASSASTSASSASTSASSASASATAAAGSATSASADADRAEDAKEFLENASATATALPEGSSPSVTLNDGVFNFAIPKGDTGARGEKGDTGSKGDKGDTGDTGTSAGFGTVSASVDDSVGTPSVEVTTSGTDTAKNFAFAFHNIKGAKGDKGDDGTVPDLDLILPTDTASGDIASITDGQSVVPVKSLQVTLDPIQDLHGYDKPWAGGSGKNLFDASATTNVRDFSRSGEVFTNTQTDTRASIKFGAVYYSNGSVIGVSNDVTITATGRYSTVLIIPTGTDKLRIRNSGSNRDLFFEYAFNGEGTYTLSADFTSVDPTTVGGLVIKDIQLESGSTATAFEPYSNICPIDGHTEVDTIVSPTQSASDGTTYTTTLGRTVYGGTLDVVSGELVVDRAMVDLGSLNWIYRSNLGGMSAALSPMAKDQFKAVCSIYPYGGAYYDLADKQCGYVYDNQIFVKDSDYTDEAAFKTAMNGVQLVYELATPQTYQLTPQTISLLKGNNNVWSDGSVVMVYNADVGLYIDKKLGTSGTRTLSMTRTLAKSEDTDDTKSVQLAEDIIEKGDKVDDISKEDAI